MHVVIENILTNPAWWALLVGLNLFLSNILRMRRNRVRNILAILAASAESEDREFTLRDLASLGANIWVMDLLQKYEGENLLASRWIPGPRPRRRSYVLTQIGREGFHRVLRDLNYDPLR